MYRRSPSDKSFSKSPPAVKKFASLQIKLALRQQAQEVSALVVNFAVGIDHGDATTSFES
jgi:hypothetical protein